MTITLSTTLLDDIARLSSAVFLALQEKEPDLAREAAACDGRDAAEYMGAVLALRPDLEVVWKEAS